MVDPMTSEDVQPELAVSVDKVCAIAAKAKEFDAKDEVTEPDPGSNPTDDKAISILEDHGDDPVLQELLEMIGGLSSDEQIELVALTWLGRGDYTVDEWENARALATAAHNERTAEYLCGTPLLGDYLEDGLAQLDRSCS